MSAQIIELHSEANLDQAWRDYQVMAARAVADSKLLLDREFFDEMTRREDRYKRLLIAQERVG